MFIKDNSGLVINTDDGHYKTILAKRQQKKSFDKLESQISEIKAELADIKSTLEKLLDGNN